MQYKQTGLILEGGASRGIFTAGVLDYLLEKDVDFSYVMGVSAGYVNAVNYMAKQKGRAKQVFTHENCKPYYGVGELLRHGQAINLKTFVVDYALKQFPLDFETFYKTQQTTKCECIATECETGKEHIFSDFHEDMQLLKANMASCAVPFACDPVEIDGRHYLDGSLINSIPVERALEMGCSKLVVVLTRPEGGKPTDYSKMKTMIELKYRKKYSKLCDIMLQRKDNYGKQQEYLEQLEREGKAFIIRPDETVGHFEKKYDKLCECYQKGYDMMKDRYEEFVKFLEA